MHCCGHPENKQAQGRSNKYRQHQSKLMRRNAAVLLLLLIDCFAAAAAGSAVTDLSDDATFEHVTQASTGLGHAAR